MPTLPKQSCLNHLTREFANRMTIFDEINHVQRLAEAEAEGDPSAHSRLLAAIRKLQLAAEKPIDTTSRVNFQVCFMI